MARAEVPSPPATSRLVQIAAAIVMIWALRYAKEVLVPIALAVLLSFLLAPLVHRVERWKLGRVPSALLVVILAFSVLAGLGYIIAGQVLQLEHDLPKYQENIQEKARYVKQKIGGLSRAGQIISDLSAPATTQSTTQTAAAGGAKTTDSPPKTSTSPPVAASANDGVPKVQIVPNEPPVLDAAMSTVGPAFDLLATAFIIVVLVIFLLIEREDMRDRLIRVVSHGQLSVTTQAIEEAATRVSRYLLMQSIINGTYGFLVGVGLYALGIPNAPLWGLLAGLLRFIPYVGPWLGASMPILLSLAIFPGATKPLMTIGMFAGFEVICSSVIEPWLYGANTGVSSIAILAAAVFWAWVWGPVGLILSTPLTVLLVVIGKYVPQLEFFSVLLGDEDVFDPQTRYYQRLLALDQEEAGDLVEDFLKERSLEDVYEHIMLPVLRLAESDRHRGRLDVERHAFIHETIREEMEEFSEVPPKPSAGEVKNPPVRIPGAEKVRVLCLPARDDADDISGSMFAQVLKRGGFQADAVSVTALASEMIDMVESKQADFVVISALPPAAITHARYLCKRLHARFPKLPVMIGLWTMQGDMLKAARRISCAEHDMTVNTFSAAMKEIEQRMHSMVLREDKKTDRPEKTTVIATV